MLQMLLISVPFSPSTTLVATLPPPSRRGRGADSENRASLGKDRAVVVAVRWANRLGLEYSLDAVVEAGVVGRLEKTVSVGDCAAKSSGEYVRSGVREEMYGYAKIVG